MAAACALAACGGSADNPALPPDLLADDGSDSADAATQAEAQQLVEAAYGQSYRLLEQASAAAAAPPTRAGRATAFAAKPGPGWFPGVRQSNLVANKPEYEAQILEPEMQNAWGIAIRPAGFGGHWWIGAASTGKSIQYVGDVGGTPLFQDDLKIVNTLGPVSGVAFNPGQQFVITQAHANGPITNASKFFFANLSGTISAWTERARSGGGFDHPGDSVVVVDATAQGSSFAGVAVSPGNDRMLAADFGALPALRVYDGQFNELPGITNPYGKTPGGFEAFNVQTLGQSIFAMYGRHVPPGTSPVPREGRLAEFNANGQLAARWFGRGALNYPWGVALAPKSFGLYGGCLLVGNFGEGTIVAFHPRLKVALDYVRDANGNRVVIDGLWGLQFGNGASLGEANHLYFAAGPNKEKDGLFGKLEANPTTLPHLGSVSLCR